MNPSEVLRELMEGSFLSGATSEHDEDEMMELLDGINWNSLRQALLLEAMPVYEFTASGTANGRMNYLSRNLFGIRAVCLDEDIKFPLSADEDNQVNSYSLELWLLEDCSLAVTSCYRMRIGSSTYRSEYRTVKAYDWQETDMDVDFCCVADTLEHMCEMIEAHGFPVIEV